MLTNVHGSDSFQVLTSSFSISPSEQGYVLNISANGKDFSPLFTVGAGVTRLVTGMASGSYYKLVGNESDVVVNWVRSCVTEGGSGGSGATYTAGAYIDITQDVISVTGITPDLYLTSADTADFLTSADTQNFVTSAYVETKVASAFTYINEVEQVTASGYTELHDGLMEVSARTVFNPALYTPTSGFATINGSAITAGGNIEIQAGGITSADVKTQIEAYNYMDSTDAQVISTALVDLNTRVSGLSAASADYLTSADTQNFITSAATAHMVVSSDDSIVNIVKIEQTAYDALVAQSATSQTTLYVVVPDSI